VCCDDFASERRVREEGKERNKAKTEGSKVAGAGESGESYEDVLCGCGCCSCSIWKRRGCGMGDGKGELGPGAWECCDHELGVWDVIGWLEMLYLTGF
jgi:hypothetical protein